MFQLSPFTFFLHRLSSQGIFIMVSSLLWDSHSRKQFYPLEMHGRKLLFSALWLISALKEQYGKPKPPKYFSLLFGFIFSFMHFKNFFNKIMQDKVD